MITILQGKWNFIKLVLKGHQITSTLLELMLIFWLEMGSTLLRQMLSPIRLLSIMDSTYLWSGFLLLTSTLLLLLLSQTTMPVPSTLFILILSLTLDPALELYLRLMDYLVSIMIMFFKLVQAVFILTLLQMVDAGLMFHVQPVTILISVHADL